MGNSLLLKYRIRFFLKIFLRIFFVVISISFCVGVYLCFFKADSTLYKKRNEFTHLTKILLNNFNYDICSQFYIDGILYANYFNIQNNVNKYCVDISYTINDLKSDILEDSWIKSVSIFKKYPNRLEIKVVEYNPFAIWVNKNGEHKLIDEYGDIINVPTREVKEFKNLFIIVGDNVEPEIYNIFNLLSIYNNISSNIVKIVRVGDRRWNLVFKNGTIVKLPEEDKDFFKVWRELDKIVTTSGNDNNLQIIDLRIKNKIYLKYKNAIEAS